MSGSVSPKRWRLRGGKNINKEQLGNAFCPYRAAQSGFQ